MNSNDLQLMSITDELLNIVYNQDEFTTSDLQSAIGAQVRIAYLLGKAQYGRKDK